MVSWKMVWSWRQRKVQYPDGSMEDPADMIGAITDVVSDAIQAGSAQRAELRKGFQLVYETKTYGQYGLSAVDEVLRISGNKTAQTLRERLYPLTPHNTFISGQDFLTDNKINIVRLSRFNLKTQQMVAELLLSYIWRLANVEKFKQNAIYLNR